MENGRLQPSIPVLDLLDDDRLTLAGLLAESYTGLRSLTDRRLIEECGLPLQWFVMLLRLARSPDQRLRMSDLADQTNLTPSGLTRAIDRLTAEERDQLAAILRKVRDHVNPGAARPPEPIPEGVAEASTEIA
jgi:hypothetical protein